MEGTGCFLLLVVMPLLLVAMPLFGFGGSVQSDVDFQIIGYTDVASICLVFCRAICATCRCRRFPPLVNRR